MSTLEHPDDEPSSPSEPERSSDGEPAEVPATLDDTDVQPAPHPPDAEAGQTPREDGTLEQQPPADPLDADEISVDPRRVRHAPRFGRFATVGGVFGMALAFLLAPFARYEDLEIPWHLDPWGLALVLTVILVPLGILAGCMVALALDRRSRRRLGR